MPVRLTDNLDVFTFVCQYHFLVHYALEDHLVRHLKIIHTYRFFHKFKTRDTY